MILKHGLTRFLQEFINVGTMSIFYACRTHLRPRHFLAQSGVRFLEGSKNVLLGSPGKQIGLQVIWRVQIEWGSGLLFCSDSDKKWHELTLYCFYQPAFSGWAYIQYFCDKYWYFAPSPPLHFPLFRHEKSVFPKYKLKKSKFYFLFKTF